MNECIFSEDRKYRYVLKHKINDGDKIINWIALNPSTADENTLDNTVRRCINFSYDWGFDICIVTNIFAFRATNPKDMMKEQNPVGDLNDWYILKNACVSDVIVQSWGNHGEHMDRFKEVSFMLKRALIDNIYCLGVTKLGQPKHPLYISKNTKLQKILYGKLV